MGFLRKIQEEQPSRLSLRRMRGGRSRMPQISCITMAGILVIDDHVLGEAKQGSTVRCGAVVPGLAKYPGTLQNALQETS
jgi:hypothetical protein